MWQLARFLYSLLQERKLAHSILAHMIYNGVATALSLISIANAPLNIVDVSTTSSSIEFSLKINEATVQRSNYIVKMMLEKSH